MSASIELMTAEELLNLPDDGLRHELVRGELRHMSPVGSHHGYLAMEIAVHLSQYVKTHRLGRVYAAETGFHITRDPDTVRAPDAAFVRQERIDVLGETNGYWPEAPDLAIEVISPSDRDTEVDEKVHEWLAAGCRLVIVVNPRRRSVMVHRGPSDVTSLTTADVLDGGDVVPGWRLPVGEIFGTADERRP